MSELVFECDPARDIRRRAFLMLALATFLWTVVAMYLSWMATPGFVVIALFLAKALWVPKALSVEVSLDAYECRVRRSGEDEWVTLKRMPRTWGKSLSAPVPESVLPFGVLWLTEAMLGPSRFREVRSLVRSAE